METVVTENKFFEQGNSVPRGGSTRVLKHGDLFGIFDAFGDVDLGGLGEQGLFYQGTRHLCRSRMRVAGHDPMLLNSSIAEDNTRLFADLTTCDFRDENGDFIHKGTIHVFRAQRLWENALHEHLRFSNYGGKVADIQVEFEFGLDGADIFEVRGVAREKRGQVLPSRRAGEESLILEYRGLDGAVRQSEIRFSRTPRVLDPRRNRVCFLLTIPPGRQLDLRFSVACRVDGSPPEFPDQGEAHQQARQLWERHLAETASVESSSERFNDLVHRARADLAMLNTRMESGFYPYAGVPWFSTPFGRDGIITALQNLWRDPATARGVLQFLARHQSAVDDPKRDAEPGKILHELRQGEMAALDEIPYAAYYGSVDSTPLFLMLAGAYYRRTGDLELIESLWRNLEAALTWLERHGDLDGDGFLEYRRRSTNGILHQGWKDSDDSVFHADGTAAEGPIALCEVQGYAYAARMEMAMLAEETGRHGLASRLVHEAQDLKIRFHDAFWCEELGTYALALDGDKRRCEVRSSNAGHCLYAGIASEEHAARLVESLTAPDLFTGWGLRTLSSREVRYNPMSYHNGSIWPHDNGIVAMGMARYGFHEAALKVMTGIMEAGLAFELRRLPELFCGFERVPGQHPTLYPVACSPQAWSCGSIFHLIQAVLGLSFRASKPQLVFRRPVLPKNISRLQIHNLLIPGGCVDLVLNRHPRDVGFSVLKKEGDVEVSVLV